MKTTTNANVLKTNESRVRQRQQNKIYMENRYGIDLIKVWIKNQNIHPIIVVFIDRRAMFL
jgi:hypothetical protein